MTNLTLTLASASPRRKELLASLYKDFTTLAVDIEEVPSPLESPADYVSRLAKEKALAGLSRLKNSSLNSWVLGADTIVVCDNKILEKPRDFADFEATMKLLSGQEHQVMTAICLTSEQQTFSQRIVTKVSFRALTEKDIAQYWQTGEPKDKAGGYGIQGIAARFVQSITGSYSAVVGLPLCETEALLKRAGFECAMFKAALPKNTDTALAEDKE